MRQIKRSVIENSLTKYLNNFLKKNTFYFYKEVSLNLTALHSHILSYAPCSNTTKKTFIRSTVIQNRIYFNVFSSSMKHIDIGLEAIQTKNASHTPRQHCQR